MKTLLLALLACLPTAQALAQTPLPLHLPATGPRVASFIPPGYGILPESPATGDLNHDGRPDVALVLRPAAEAPADSASLENLSEQPRYLVVLLRTPTGYALAAQAGRVALCQACGDGINDPFDGLGIEKGVLNITHYGGGGERWRITSRFRYQQGSFYLIGETRLHFHSSRFCGNAGRERLDTNFVTGAYREEKDSERCRPVVRSTGRRKPAPLRRLADYAVVP